MILPGVEIYTPNYIRTKRMLLSWQKTMLVIDW
nr:MAG TPA: hypothetical protein [Caudoviricetes sp.]